MDDDGLLRLLVDSMPKQEEQGVDRKEVLLTRLRDGPDEGGVPTRCAGAATTTSRTGRPWRSWRNRARSSRKRCSAAGHVGFAGGWRRCLTEFGLAVVGSEWDLRVFLGVWQFGELHT